MRSARFCLFILLIVSGLARISYSAETTVEWNYLLTTSNSTNSLSRGRSQPPIVDPDGGPLVSEFNDNLESEAHEASATVQLQTVAEIGATRVTLIGGGISQFEKAEVTAKGTANWLDRIQLAVPASSGLGFSNIFVNGILNVHGNMSVVGSGTVSLSLRDTDPRFELNTLPPGPFVGLGFPSSTWGFAQNDIAPLLPPAQIPVRLGVNLGGVDLERGLFLGSRLIGYQFTVDINSIANGGHSSLASGEFGNTLSWGGITSVEDSSGRPVTDYVVTSESGFDYSKPYGVPEPSGIQLLALGGVLIAFGAALWTVRARRQPFAS